MFYQKSKNNVFFYWSIIIKPVAFIICELSVGQPVQSLQKLLFLSLWNWKCNQFVSNVQELSKLLLDSAIKTVTTSRTPVLEVVG